MSPFLILGDIDFAKDFFGCSGVKNNSRFGATLRKFLALSPWGRYAQGGKFFR